MSDIVKWADGLEYNIEKLKLDVENARKIAVEAREIARSAVDATAGFRKFVGEIEDKILAKAEEVEPEVHPVKAPFNKDDRCNRENIILEEPTDEELTQSLKKVFDDEPEKRALESLVRPLNRVLDARTTMDFLKLANTSLIESGSPYRYVIIEGYLTVI